MKNVSTLGFAFCNNNSFNNGQPLVPCSFSTHEIARYVTHSVMLRRICSSDIPAHAQGVISICWDAMTKSEIAVDVKWETAQRHMPQPMRQHKDKCPKTMYILPSKTVTMDSLPFTATIFVSILMGNVLPSHISTPKACKISITCWTEHPLTAIQSPYCCTMF
jgi:hypothetical protein